MKKNGALNTEFNFRATLQHPLAKKGLVEMLPTYWVLMLSNPKSGNQTDLTPGGSKLVGLSELWQNMIQEGMRDPFILTAGRHSRDSRLEAGNHRIKLFYDNNVPFVPATVLVGDQAKQHKGNGDHSFYRELLLPVQNHSNAPYDERNYQKPSSVFKEILSLKHNGQIPRINF
jgi:hypothetical protein